MTHTKRTPEFMLRVKRLAEKVLSGTLSADERSEVAHLLHYNTTDSGCLVRAAEDEPIFVLRGKDPIAAGTVRRWVEAAELEDLHGDKTEDAWKCVDEMAAYRR